MAMSVGRPRAGTIADINVTPMADVMIVLLIIFMVATPIIARPVPLPLAAHLTQHPGEKLEIVVRRDGGIALDGAALASAEVLAEYIAARMPAPESLRVVIQADRDVAYAELARVLNACRQARVGEVALAAELKPGS